MVMRAQSNFFASSCSEGSLNPGAHAPDTIFRRSAS
jgi:hypothetical protein